MGDYMLEIAAGLLIALLCVAGTASIIKWIALKMSAPVSEDDRIYAVLLFGSGADIKLQMAMETLEWDSALHNAKAYAVDCGMDDVLAEYCEGLCENSRFRFVSAEQFSEFVNSLGKT